jgi:hypothetical protein
MFIIFESRDILTRWQVIQWPLNRLQYLNVKRFCIHYYVKRCCLKTSLFNTCLSHISHFLNQFDDSLGNQKQHYDPIWRNWYITTNLKPKCFLKHHLSTSNFNLYQPFLVYITMDRCFRIRIQNSASLLSHAFYT